MDENKIINALLKKIITHSSRCNHCKYFHQNFCFFAYSCLTKDFYFFDDGD